jgi:hypothetical protein
MRQLVITSLMLLATVLALGSNSSADTGEKGDKSMEGRLDVQRIEVKVVRAVHPQVFVRVHGVVLNGCTDIGEVEQHKNGNIVSVTIPTFTRHSVCTMMARLIDETIRLDGDFGPGSYTVNVNDVVQRFRV